MLHEEDVEAKLLHGFDNDGKAGMAVVMVSWTARESSGLEAR
jgi:hypothetical protein